MSAPLVLRPDQQQAIAAVLAALAEGVRRPLVAMPTGSGKSVVLASLAATLAGEGKRVLALAHRGELIQQNAGALARLDPLADFGICHAGSGRDDLESRIVIASTATVYRRLRRLSAFDTVLLDECHLLTPTDDGMLTRIMERLAELAGGEEPPLIGLTATPFRTDAGSLIETGLFEKIVYERQLADMIAEGLLSPIRTKVPRAGQIETAGIRIVAGDYNAAQLEAAAMASDLTEQAVARAVEVGRAENRKSWLFFGASVDHAHRIERALAAHQVAAATITGETPPDVRAQTIARFRAGELTALVNCNVLTTGFDAPSTDLLAVLRPTCSPVLWVQMCGRGTRTAPGKTDVLLLDFGNNLIRHGPIDDVRLDKTGMQKRKEYPALRTCTRCDELLPKGARCCPSCGEPVPQREPPKIAAVECGEDAIAGERRGQRGTLARVIRLSARVHTKAGSPPSLRVYFHMQDGSTVSDFWAVEHPNAWAKNRARERWASLSRSPRQAPPKTAAEAFRRFVTGEITTPPEVMIETRGAWPTILAVLADEQAQAAAA